MRKYKKPIWRWFFGTLLLGVILPLVLSACVILLDASHHSLIVLFDNGDLFLFALAILASAWTQICQFGDEHEVTRDLTLLFIAVTAGAWVVCRSIRATGGTLDGAWVTWSGVASVAFSAWIGVTCTVIRVRAGKA